jgi:hypothetical protein
MWKWIRKIRTFFRLHDYEIMEIKTTPICTIDFFCPKVKCRKCGKEDRMFSLGIIGNPSFGFWFYHGCTGKMEKTRTSDTNKQSS